MSSKSLTPSLCAQLACILEVTAPKAGNVHRFQDFDDTTYVDFLISAAAMAPALAKVNEMGIGPTILDAITRTHELVGKNTNLGIVLLLVPLATIFYEDGDLRTKLRDRLKKTTVEDAEFVYKAIRLASPGGLGKVSEEDVHKEPTRTLLQVMELAAERDLIASQYTSAFEDVFELGLPALAEGSERGLHRDQIVVFCHLKLLANLPDSLIQRKTGSQEDALRATRMAHQVLEMGWPDRETGLAAFKELDQWMRADGNRRNPGATADLTAASLFLAIRNGALQP